MRRPRWAPAPAALVLVGGLVVSGCGEDRESERLPRTQDAATSDGEEDGATAEEQAAFRVHQLVDGRNALRRGPGTYTDPKSIGFAEEKLAKAMIAESNTLDRKGRKQEGTTQLVGEPEVTETDLNPPKEGDAQPAPFVELRACVDASDTRIVNSKGKKVTDSEGTGPRPMKYRVINRSWPAKSGWKVAWEEPIKGSC